MNPNFKSQVLKSIITEVWQHNSILNLLWIINCYENISKVFKPAIEIYSSVLEGHLKVNISGKTTNIKF